MGKQWKQWQTIFLGSKITADGDCCHENKRHLLLGRKAMTKLHSVLKSRDITLLTKVHLVKAMFFPVVMCGCESWTIKKADHQRIDAFELEKTLDSPLDCKKIKPVNPKRNQPWKKKKRKKEISPEYSLDGLMLKLKLQYFWPPDAKNLLTGKDHDARKDWGQEEKEVTEDEVVGWHHWLDGH